AFIEKPPSPTTAITGASGLASLAPIAALKPYDIPESPFDIQNVSGCRLGQNCPNRYLCDPTSVVTIVSGGAIPASALMMSPGHIVPAPSERSLNMSRRFCCKSRNVARVPEAV